VVDFEGLLNRDGDTGAVWEEEINERVRVLNYIKYLLSTLRSPLVFSAFTCQ
jgi:hypothetical protein